MVVTFTGARGASGPWSVSTSTPVSFHRTAGASTDSALLAPALRTSLLSGGRRTSSIFDRRVRWYGQSYPDSVQEISWFNEGSES